MADKKVINKIIEVVEEKFPNKTVLQIVDYEERGIYVVTAIPKDKLDKKDKWVDNTYSVDNKTFEVISGFQPLVNNPSLYFSIADERIIYKRGEKQK